MNVTLSKVTEKEKDTFKNLFQFFAYDFSEMNEMSVEKNGLFLLPEDIDSYYTEPNYNSFFILVDNKMAGVAIIKNISEENINYLRHFFVMRKYRRLKIGQSAVHMLIDMFPGKWRVSQFDFNKSAISFWRKVIERFTNDDYIEMRRVDGKGPQQEFYSTKFKE